jgi:5'-nucleotidase
MAHILVTNDDGMQSPGLLALKNALSAIGRVTVMAPDHNWSAGGHVKTLHKPLRISETKLSDGTPAFTTTGAPSDCVALACLGFIPEPIDLVVSGINQGFNLGHDVTYSGTVTAAMEGVINGIPSIAVSLGWLPEMNYDCAAHFVTQLAPKVLANGLPPYTLLNVNVPNLPADQVKGVMITRLGLRKYRDELDKRLDPRGRPYYWIAGEPEDEPEEEGTDVWAVRNAYISVTPLHLDLTAYPMLETLGSWDLGI